MDGFGYLKNVATLKYHSERCIGCGRCAEVCPHQVFVVETARAKLVDFDACIECGACAQNCPVAAIVVDAGAGCASGLISEWLQEKKLKRGGCC